MIVEANHAGDRPKIAATAYVHQTAVLIGNVEIGERVYIGPNAVIRADEPGPDGTVGAIILREESNIQDGVVIHALGGTGVEIGPRSSLAHTAVVHGPCRIGADTFVGFGSVIFNASLADSVIVMHRALVEDVTVHGGLFVPPMATVRSDEALERLDPAPPDMEAFALKVQQTNVFLAEAALKRTYPDDSNIQVAIIMGSKSDLDVMKEGAQVLTDFGVPHELRIISAHRTPDIAHSFATEAADIGIRVIIAGAGKSAHLAGVLASLTTLPVIGVPMTTSDLGGLDSLLSTVQMPGGIPVATTAIGKAGAKNAALMAVAILALSDPDLAEMLKAYRWQMRADVIEADTEARGNSNV